MAPRRVTVVDPRSQRHEVALDIADDASGEHLIECLSEHGFGARPVLVGERIVTADATIASLDLERGAVVTIAAAGSRPTAIEAVPHLVVVAGPDAGHIVALPAGARAVVGRGDDCDLRVDDRVLSARHFEAVSDGEHVRITDLGSTNGTAIEGEGPTESHQVGHGDHLRAGSSVFAVHRPLADESATLGAVVDGRRTLPRQFRPARSELPDRLEPPRRRDDADDEPARSTWWRALVPIVTGFGFAWITGRWIFLLVMIIGPIVMAVEAWRRKNQVARRDARRQARYEQDLATFRADAMRLRHAERTRRRDLAHTGGLAAMHTAGRHRRLWERRPADDDFGTVTIGLAALESDIIAIDPDGALPERQWGSPLQHDLVAVGALAITGSTGRGRAVARSLLLNLAATHSPSEVRVWLVTDDRDGAAWDGIRWLPHADDGPTRSLVATSATDAAGVMRRLRTIADERRAGAPDRTTPLPLHVVVVDGVDLVPAGELADLVADPTSTGITAITIDEVITPEGIAATLRLGDDADESVFTSRRRSETTDVFLSEMAAGVFAAAARPLAALVPATGEDAGGVPGNVSLVELDPLASADADALADHWRTRSPQSHVPIGATSDGVMRIDLVRDGPHGLIGGTSGSGKTELLKTLFLSLALHNHPDDLSIVVVDFKGGVDHDAIRPLPHVIDVSTNLDIEQFERTITLLRAESTRRQALLSEIGASNLDAYRAARTNDPALPPLPRLLVVVDEFGELLDSPEGKNRLKELESITRIGRALGLHLLLVTQSFENALPPQIDANAGLRLCLRVGKAGHSKVVLDSDAAASIPDHRIGRAYARMHGRDLVEFQTARVAGRRTDLVAGDDLGATLEWLTFDMLGAAPVGRAAGGDVPVEETDMWLMIRRIDAAAELTGWTSSAVPWPSPLPDEIPLSRLATRRSQHGVALGLADRPDEQRREICQITDRDEHVAMIGTATSEVPEAMTAYATMLALASPADDVHLYGIDLLGRSLRNLEALPHCGSIAVRNDKLALRILDTLTEIAAARRSDLATDGASSVWEQAAATGVLPPQIVLLVSGADRLIAPDSPHARLLGPLVSLMTDVVGLRVQIVLGGAPRVLHHRLGMSVDRRLVFGLPDEGEYPSLGVPKSMASQLTVDRRVVDLPAERLTQLGRLATTGRSEADAIRAAATGLADATERPPRRCLDVPWPLPLAGAGVDQATPPTTMVSPTPVGIGLDDGEWVWIDADDDGPLVAVVGPPKSGRSTALAVLGENMAGRGWRVVNVSHSRRSPLAHGPWASLPTHEVADALASAGPLVVLVDDVHRFEDGDLLLAAVQRDEPTLLVVAGPASFIGSRTGVMRSLPAVSCGVLLAPRAPSDGAALGLPRLPDDWLITPRPGRGLLAVAGEATQVQIPLLDITAVGADPSAVEPSVNS